MIVKLILTERSTSTASSLSKETKWKLNDISFERVIGGKEGEGNGGNG